MSTFETIVKRVRKDPRYLENIKYGKPRDGHPEGTIAAHIAELEHNLTMIQGFISEEVYWKLQFLVHVHDTFKAVASKDVSIEDENSHASLARKFSLDYTQDSAILNIVQYHDVNYFLWKQFKALGAIDVNYLTTVLKEVDDKSLFLIFTFVDGFLRGKEVEKLVWFYNECRKIDQYIEIDSRIVQTIGVKK